MLIALREPLDALPPSLADWPLALENGGKTLRYVFEAADEHIPGLLATLGEAGIAYSDLETHKSSLEDIFVDLVERKDAA